MQREPRFQNGKMYKNVYEKEDESETIKQEKISTATVNCFLNNANESNWSQYGLVMGNEEQNTARHGCYLLFVVALRT